MKPININSYFALSSLDSSILLFANDDKNTTIFKSIDDGNTWFKIYYLPKTRIFDYNLSTIDVYNENTIFFLTTFNTQINRLTFKPFSGTASKINSEIGINDIKMIDYERGIAGHYTQLFITNDSWINCKTIKVSGLRSLWYRADESISYVSTHDFDATKYHTSEDKGISWQTTKVGDFTAKKLYFIDDNIGFITGNIVETKSIPTSYQDIIYRTSDGGKTWLQVLDDKKNSQSELNDIVFKDAKLGITTGTSNSVYTTNNGGLTWKKQNVSTQSGNKIRNSHCGFTASKFIISIDDMGLFYIELKNIK